MRIITRPDFDGVCCAVLLKDIYGRNCPIVWLEPYEIEQLAGKVTQNDIIANLPYLPGCGYWFDHHVTNQPDQPFQGLYRMAPSAGGLIFEFYSGKFRRDYKEMVYHTDIIDSAGFTMEEVLHPENNPWHQLNFTISGKAAEESPYWDLLVMELCEKNAADVIQHPEAASRWDKFFYDNSKFRELLLANSRRQGSLSFTDFRKFDPEPSGSRFLVYALFPEAAVNLRLRYDKKNRDKAVFSLGKNIFNNQTIPSLGAIAKRYGGGGHHDAASFAVTAGEADNVLKEIFPLFSRTTF